MTKLMEGVESKDFVDSPCNCRRDYSIDGICPYDSSCRKSCIIYKATHLLTNRPYIGNTQRNFKTRMGEHFTDLKKAISSDIASDSFAKIASREYNKCPNTKRLMKDFKHEILWQGNAITISKTYGTIKCRLCAREKDFILKHRFDKTQPLMMNSRLEIRGACRHKPRFHRFIKHGTDEGLKTPILYQK